MYPCTWSAAYKKAAVVIVEKYIRPITSNPSHLTSSHPTSYHYTRHDTIRHHTTDHTTRPMTRHHTATAATTIMTTTTATAKKKKGLHRISNSTFLFCFHSSPSKTTRAVLSPLYLRKRLPFDAEKEAACGQAHVNGRVEKVHRLDVVEDA